MALKLTVETPDESIQSYEFVFDEPEISIGRSATCHIQLPFPTVSSVHLLMVLQEDLWLLADQGSTNGTRLNDRLLSPEHIVPLSDGDRVTLGTILIHVTMIDAEQATLESARTGELVRRMVLDMVRHSPELDSAEAFLEVVDGPDLGARRSLRPDGRRLGVHCDGSPQRWTLSDPTLTRVSIAVRGDQEGFWLHRAPDGSGPPPLLDGESLSEPGPWPLQSGARLRAGATTLLFVDPLQAYLNQLESPRDASSGAPPKTSPLTMDTDAPSLPETHFPADTGTARTPGAPPPQTRPSTAVGLPLQVGPDPGLIDVSQREALTQPPPPKWSFMEIVFMIAVGFALLFALTAAFIAIVG